jgi:hypothetical protein
MEKLLSLLHKPMAEESPLSQLITPGFTIYAQHSLSEGGFLLHHTLEYGMPK